eukprot:jgi/Ulvmu1/9861/UM057_0015.1
MYVGWKYHGLASQLDEPNTVEAHLFGALEKTCLVKPGVPPKEFSYTRCGRTDIGVSALANMITLEVRSKAAAGQPLPLADEELDYPFLLNKVLPSDIQITGWAPAEPSFHARFSAISRRYKYFFTGASGLDAKAMQAACDHLVGEHDFQHFCKINLANTQMHTRRIISARVAPPPQNGQSMPSDLLVLDITGTAFLWHQVRCIAAVLLMVGRGHERPDIVHELLDINRQPRKPQYDLAPEAPLILLGGEFDGLPPLRLSRLAASMLAKRVDAITRDHAARLAVLREVWGEVEGAARAAGDSVQREKHRPLLGRVTDQPLSERLEAFLAKQAVRAAAAEGPSEMDADAEADTEAGGPQQAGEAGGGAQP